VHALIEVPYTPIIGRALKAYKHFSMVRKIDWESQIGRRLRLQDLHVFFTVVQRGSMAKAAAHLGVSQPAVSEVIAGLEHALGVRLLDRSPRGVELTTYGRALLKRSRVVFDELKQGIRDIEFLADPTVGELRIGCPESVATSILPPVIQRFSQQYPRVVLRVTEVVSPTLELPELRERSLDVVLERLVRPLGDEDNDLDVEFLFDDWIAVAAGKQSPWARKRGIELAELVDETWILTPPGSWNYVNVAEAFRARGLDIPKICSMTFSVHLRAYLLASGPFISTFASSFLRCNADRLSLSVLPVDFPVRPWPVAVFTLKNRILNPAAQLFIDHLRTFTRSMSAELKPEENSA
jgi:DNA-binding transcriptional LysR family regulator